MRHIHLLHDVTWFSVESTLAWFGEIKIQDNINIQPPFPSMELHRSLRYSYQLIRRGGQGIRMKEYLRFDGCISWWRGRWPQLRRGQSQHVQDLQQEHLFRRNESFWKPLSAVWGRITLYNLTPGCTLKQRDRQGANGLLPDTLSHCHTSHFVKYYTFWAVKMM